MVRASTILIAVSSRNILIIVVNNIYLYCINNLEDHGNYLYTLIDSFFQYGVPELFSYQAPSRFHTEIKITALLLRLQFLKGFL